MKRQHMAQGILYFRNEPVSGIQIFAGEPRVKSSRKEISSPLGNKWVVNDNLYQISDSNVVLALDLFYCRHEDSPNLPNPAVVRILEHVCSNFSFDLFVFTGRL